MEANQPYRIFLSHASADKPLARRISNYLLERRINVWLDEVDIRVGESIPEKVADGLASSAAICLLVSKAASSSQWVAREYNSFLHEAIHGTKVIIPCRIDSTPMPVLIRDIKYADFVTSFEVGIVGILNAVGVKEEIQRSYSSNAHRDKVEEIKIKIRQLVQARPLMPPRQQVSTLLNAIGRRSYRVSGVERELLLEFRSLVGFTEGYNHIISVEPTVVSALEELNAGW